MESHHSSAAPPNANGGSGPSGCPENKDVAAVPNLSSAAEAAVTVSTSNDDDVSKGKSVAADDNELKPQIIAERNRGKRIKDYFGELQALMPQIPEKSDKATILGYTIDYIKSLEKEKAMLEKDKQEQELPRQAVAEATASSSSAPPQIDQDDMALAHMSSSDIPDACSTAPPLKPTVPVPAPQLLRATMSSSGVPQPLQQALAAAEPAPLPAAAEPASQRIITARQVGFQTWTWPDLVLSVSNDTAYIKVAAPRHRGMWTKVMVLSVLDKYGIEVITVTGQIDSDAVRSVFNMYARVTTRGGENPSAALEVYKLAVSEILVWLTTN